MKPEFNCPNHQAIRALHELPPTLPTFAEVERHLSVVEELIAVLSANCQFAARLRRSLLQKAFSGKHLEK